MEGYWRHFKECKGIVDWKQFLNNIFGIPITVCVKQFQKATIFLRSLPREVEDEGNPPPLQLIITAQEGVCEVILGTVSSSLIYITLFIHGLSWASRRDLSWAM